MGGVALFFKNTDSDVCNNTMLMRLQGDACVSNAYDVYVGRAKPEQRSEILKFFKLRHHKSTNGLLTNLLLKIEGKYIVSTNIDVSDGLSNGTPCVLKRIVLGQLGDQHVPLRLYVEFEDGQIGRNMRLSLKQRMLHDNVPSNWTPIERIKHFFPCLLAALLKYGVINFQGHLLSQ